MFKIEIYNECKYLCPLPKGIIKQLMIVMLKACDVEFINVALHLVRDADIAVINKENLQCIGPTNILSFPQADFQTDNMNETTDNITETCENNILPNILILSVDTLARECLLYGQEQTQHFIRLLGHGLGHVLGYDHGEEMYALCDIMENAGQEFMSNINGNVEIVK